MDNFQNDNFEFENTFNRVKQHPRESFLSDDFENRVFAKIKKKKTQRKVTASVTMIVTVFAFLFIAGPLVFKQSPEIDPAFNLANRLPKPSDAGQDLPKDWLKNREEVPALEEVIYASSDTDTNYAIETVANFDDDNTL